ncbi:unnamed protein product, partial [Mesorhabditis spiculigera]
MTMLHSTHPHFIRCIIPNEKKKQSGMIDAALVLNPAYPQRCVLRKTRRLPRLPLARIVKEKKLTDGNFRVGLTKLQNTNLVIQYPSVFRPSSRPAQIRGYYSQIEIKQRRIRYEALAMLQRNVRNWIQLRTWEWFRLLGKAIISTDRNNDDIETKDRMKEDGVRVQKEIPKNSWRSLRAPRTLPAVLREKNRLPRNSLKHKKNIEGHCAELKKNQQDLDLTLRKSEAEKQNKELPDPRPFKMKCASRMRTSAS